jgi:hypothetical protein
MGVHILRTFFSHWIQPLHQRATKMWFYLGPSCPDRPFSEELGDVEINTWIHKVLAHGADLNLEVGLAPLREGIDSTRVSPIKFVFGSLHNFILSTHSCPYAGSRVCSQRATRHQLTRGCDEAGSEPCPQRADVSMETEKADLECRSYGGEGAGEDTPTQLESLNEEEEEGDLTPPPLSLLHETLPRLVISSVSKQGSQSAYATQSGPR